MRLLVSANEVCLVCGLLDVNVSVPVVFLETNFPKHGAPGRLRTSRLQEPWGPGVCFMPEGGLGDMVKPGQKCVRQGVTVVLVEGRQWLNIWTPLQKTRSEYSAIGPPCNERWSAACPVVEEG